jgi:hypothetical protein
MKLDPGMHIGLHLVFFGKSGVTSSCPNCISSYGEIHRCSLTRTCASSAAVASRGHLRASSAAGPRRGVGELCCRGPAGLGPCRIGGGPGGAGEGEGMTDGDWLFFLRDTGGRAAGKESLRFLFFVAAGGGLQTVESWEAGIFFVWAHMSC